MREERSAKLAELYELEILGRELGQLIYSGFFFNYPSIAPLSVDVQPVYTVPDQISVSNSISLSV